MTPLLRARTHAHALVRHAFRRRRPAVHGPVFRAAALLTGLAVASTTLAVTTARASAAEKAPARRFAAVKAVLARAASPAPGRDAAASPPPASPLESVLTGLAPAPDQSMAPLLPTKDDPAPETSPPTTGSPTTDPSITGSPTTGSSTTGSSTTGPPETRPGGAEPSPSVAPLGAAAAGPAAANAPPALPDGIPESRRVEHGFAVDVLREQGIRWRSTGGCSDRNVRTCTSFEKIRWGTIKGLVRFARWSGCDIVVTGGTERGHASGVHSHWNGYKADIAPSRCVDRAIERHPSAGVRGDGARLHRSPDGVLFARERNHWDITFR